jgi:hypothetical protein
VPKKLSALRPAFACMPLLPCWHLPVAAEISHLKACIVSPTLPSIHRCSFVYCCAVFSMATASPRESGTTMISGSKGEMWLALWIHPFVLVGSLSLCQPSACRCNPFCCLKSSQIIVCCLTLQTVRMIGGASLLPGKRLGTATRSNNRCTNARWDIFFVPKKCQVRFWKNRGLVKLTADFM